MLVCWPDILVYQCSAFQKILLTWLAFTPLILLGMSTAVVPPAATCPASCPSPWTTLSQPISRPHTKLQPIKVVQSFLRVFRDQPWCLCQLWLQSGISKALLDSLEDARETLMRLIPKSAAGNLKFCTQLPCMPIDTNFDVEMEINPWFLPVMSSTFCPTKTKQIKACAKEFLIVQKYRGTYPRWVLTLTL